MKLSVVIEPAARSELDERLAQLSFVDPTAAGRLCNDVASLLDLISEFPEIYERYDAKLRRAGYTRIRQLLIRVRPHPRRLERG
ncbi:MAG: hypothetical protein AB7F22_00770 [Reyranella sp.]|uniref:hypothetical protein n=1 Tax=Reyranella sp. TaxID=1929291 RepID=UPI003D13D686